MFNLISKKYWCLFIPILLTFLLVFSCSIIGGNQGGSNPSGNGGTLNLTLNSDSIPNKTIVPGIDMNPATYDVSGDGPNGATFQSLGVTGTTLTMPNLVIGNWIITVNAKNAGGTVIGTGQTSVTVVKNTTVNAAVTVNPLNGTGGLSITVDWTSATQFTANATVVGMLNFRNATGYDPTVDLSFTKSGKTATYTNAALQTGYYRLAIVITEGSNSLTILPDGGALRIVYNQTTAATVNVANVSGGINITIIVNMQNPIVITLNGTQSPLPVGSTMNVSATTSPSPVDSYEWSLDGAFLGTSSTITVGSGLIAGNYVLSLIVCKGAVMGSTAYNFTVGTSSSSSSTASSSSVSSTASSVSSTTSSATSTTSLLYQSFEETTQITSGNIWTGNAATTISFNSTQKYEGANSLQFNATLGSNNDRVNFSAQSGTVWNFNLNPGGTYTKLVFYVKDPASTPNTVRVKIYDNYSHNTGDLFPQPGAKDANGWSKVEIPFTSLSAIDLTNINQIEIGEYWAATYYFDYFHAEGNGISSSSSSTSSASSSVSSAISSTASVASLLYQSFENTTQIISGNIWTGNTATTISFNSTQKYEGVNSLQFNATLGSNNDRVNFSAQSGTVWAFNLNPGGTYTKLVFYVKDPAATPNTVRVKIYDNSSHNTGDLFPQPGAKDANGWSKVEIPFSSLSAIDLTNINQIEIGEYWAATYYFDYFYAE